MKNTSNDIFKTVKEDLEKDHIDVVNKIKLLETIGNQLSQKGMISLGVIKRIVRYYPELLELFQENNQPIGFNIEKELEQLNKTSERIKCVFEII
ncbi:MAG: hypothetical protein E7H33_09735 [Clostridium perfringens]|nr:hypothetical protein [Clostridium perfringens]